MAKRQTDLDKAIARIELDIDAMEQQLEVRREVLRSLTQSRTIKPVRTARPQKAEPKQG